MALCGVHQFFDVRILCSRSWSMKQPLSMQNFQDQEFSSIIFKANEVGSFSNGDSESYSPKVMEPSALAPSVIFSPTKFGF